MTELLLMLVCCLGDTKAWSRKLVLFKIQLSRHLYPRGHFETTSDQQQIVRNSRWPRSIIDVIYILTLIDHGIYSLQFRDCQGRNLRRRTGRCDCLSALQWMLLWMRRSMGGTHALVGVIVLAGAYWILGVALVLHSPYSRFNNLKIGSRRWQSRRLGETTGALLLLLLLLCGMT